MFIVFIGPPGVGKEISDEAKIGGMTPAVLILNGICVDWPATFIYNVMNRITLVGAIYLALVCVIPEILINQLHVPFY